MKKLWAAMVFTQSMMCLFLIIFLVMMACVGNVYFNGGALNA